jgi:ADP-ribose pyrophosphatase YjhB (NUDIX family)
MISQHDVESFFSQRLPRYLPSLAVDCVVFGFHDDDLKVLLLKWKGMKTWALPGGFVQRQESLDAAARRVLTDRTGLRRVYLQQFHAFGSTRRKETDLLTLFTRLGLAVQADAWPFLRVVSIGYYALVESSKVKPQVDYMSDVAAWHPVAKRPRLAFDHDAIVAKALASLRASLDAVPDASVSSASSSPSRSRSPSPSPSGSPSGSIVGATLLPPRFTMPELQRLHEAILGRPLDRRNFQKRILERGTVERLPERRTGGAHRAPFLYRFARISQRSER